MSTLYYPISYAHPTFETPLSNLTFQHVLFRWMSSSFSLSLTSSSPFLLADALPLIPFVPGIGSFTFLISPLAVNKMNGSNKAGPFSFKTAINDLRICCYSQRLHKNRTHFSNIVPEDDNLEVSKSPVIQWGYCTLSIIPDLAVGPYNKTEIHQFSLPPV